LIKNIKEELGMLFDAIVAVIIFKLFGEQGLWVLGITCVITILRTAGNINRAIGCLFVNEEEEEN
jgi:uncharacterized membrane protein YgaE (UPF0421/DUF939 family)